MLFHRVRCALLSLASCSFLGQQLFVQTIPPAQAAIPPDQGQTSKTYPLIRPGAWTGSYASFPTAEQACQHIANNDRGGQRVLRVELYPPIENWLGLRVHSGATCILENWGGEPTQVFCPYDHPPYDPYVYIGGTKGICVLSSVLQKPELVPHLPSLSETLASFPELSEALTQVPLPQLTQEGGYTKTDPSQPQPEIQVAAFPLALPLVALMGVLGIIIVSHPPTIPSFPVEEAETPPPQIPTDNGTDSQATNPDQPPSQPPTDDEKNRLPPRKPYVNNNPAATADEIRVGELLNGKAQNGEIPGVAEVEGASEIPGSRSGDYRLTDSAGNKTSGDLYQPESDNPNTIRDGIIKKSDQAETVVVELGAGRSGQLDASKAKQIAEEVINTPGHGVNRVIVIKENQTIVDLSR